MAAAVGHRDVAGGWRRPRPTSAPCGGALGVPPPHPGGQPGPALRFCAGGGHSGPPSPGPGPLAAAISPLLLEGSGLALGPRQPPAVLRGPGHTWAPRPLQTALSAGRAADTASPTPRKSRDPTGGKGTRGPGARAAHLAPAQDPGTAGEAASVDLTALAARRRPPPGSSHSLPLAGRLGQGLSCSGPWCPPPAPACHGAAAAVPAHPSPGPSGSRPCTW